MNTQATHWEKHISYFASQLSDLFPDLELRFTITFDTLTLNVCGQKSVEFSLLDKAYATLLHEATFTVKMLTKRFDA